MSTHCVPYVELQQYTTCEVDLILYMALTTDKVSWEYPSHLLLTGHYISATGGQVQWSHILLLGSYSRAQVRDH